MLANPQVTSKLMDTKASAEVKVLNDFYEMMKNDPNRAFYGLKHVMYANERLAIQTLLISDQLFRSSDIATRKLYVQLVESVKENQGEVYIFSSMHVSGEQLSQITGIAAILRFPIPDLEDEDEDEDEDDDEEEDKETRSNGRDPTEKSRDGEE